MKYVADETFSTKFLFLKTMHLEAKVSNPEPCSSGG